VAFEEKFVLTEEQSASNVQVPRKRYRLDLLLGLLGSVGGFVAAKVAEMPVYAGSIAGLLLGFAAGESIVRLRRERIAKKSGAQ
jgi:hypothetical protein